MPGGICPTCKTASVYVAKSSGKRQGYCRPCALASRREWARKNKERDRAHTRKSKYKIPMERALALNEQTVCDVCRQQQACLHLDHNHATGQVRGLLCKSCNHFLGWIEKHGHALTGLLGYLAKYNAEASRA